jgi:diguanylate cyclase (GGDEF)-like protein
LLDRGKVLERDRDGHPLMMYGTHTDITEKKTMEQKIHEMAIRDPLTEVYNRRYIFERLDAIAAEHSRVGRNFCVSILDIDHFKDVNDTYGHQAGDFALRELALTVSASIRQYDLLGRYGGEEFIIVSPSAFGAETVKLVDRILGSVCRKVFSVKGSDIRLTFSCGVADSAEFTPSTFSIEALVSLADKRLYAAKEGGRNRCIGPGDNPA